MIQRIQTVYMLIADLLIGLLFFVPFGEIVAKAGGLYRVDIKGLYLEGVPKPEIISSNMLVMIVWILGLLLIGAAIFMYNNRKRQMGLSMINIFIVLTLGALIYYDVWSGAKLVSGQSSLTLYFTFPEIAAILIYMAYRSIGKDELLVRSIDRIR